MSFLTCMSFGVGLLLLAFMCHALILGSFSLRLSILIQQAQFAVLSDNHKKAVQTASQAIDLISLWKEKRKKNVFGNRSLIKALELRSYAYRGVQDFASALADAETWIWLAPHDKNSYFQRGTVLIYLNETKLAREDFSYLLRLNLSRWFKSDVYHNLGLIDYIEGNYTGALSHYTQSMSFSPLGPQAITHVNIGIVHFCQNNMPAAWAAYYSAQKIDPSHEHVRVGLAVLHASQGEWDQALKIWRELRLKNPYFHDPEEVNSRFYRWTPSMAAVVEEIVAHLEKRKRSVDSIEIESISSRHKASIDVHELESEPFKKKEA